MDIHRTLLCLSTTLLVVRSFSPPNYPKHEIIKIGRRFVDFSPNSYGLGLHNMERLFYKQIPIRQIRSNESPELEGNIDAESSALPSRKDLSKIDYPLVVLIGGSGFLGSEIRQQLNERGVNYTATSTRRDRKKSFVPLDLTANDAEEKIQKLLEADASKSNRKISIISAMGVIGTKDDEQVNAALVNAIRGAKRADQESERIKRFVMIGNPRRVRRLSKKLPFLKGYANGKEEAESALRLYFDERGCIIKPSFIYGGDRIKILPPRIPNDLGNIASEVLGMYPLQALSDMLPDALAVPLSPPVSVKVVAAAAINVALGIVDGYTDELEGKEVITMAGSVRSWKDKIRYEKWARENYEDVEDKTLSNETCSVDLTVDFSGEELHQKRIMELKSQILLQGQAKHLDKGNIGLTDLMEELECMRPSSMQPAYDPKLNGKWNFVLSKDDLGTSLIKELLPLENISSGGQSSAIPLWKTLLNNFYELKGLFMRIYDEQSQVQIVLSSVVCFRKFPVDIVFTTSLLTTNYDEENEGCLFLERFESVKLGGWKVPIPHTWQRFRYLEITYLDDEVLIARGSGGDPHVLFRDYA